MAQLLKRSPTGEMVLEGAITPNQQSPTSQEGTFQQEAPTQRDFNSLSSAVQPPATSITQQPSTSSSPYINALMQLLKSAQTGRTAATGEYLGKSQQLQEAAQRAENIGTDLGTQYLTDPEYAHMTGLAGKMESAYQPSVLSAERQLSQLGNVYQARTGQYESAMTNIQDLLDKDYRDKQAALDEDYRQKTLAEQMRSNRAQESLARSQLAQDLTLAEQERQAKIDEKEAEKLEEKQKAMETVAPTINAINELMKDPNLEYISGTLRGVKPGFMVAVDNPEAKPTKALEKQVLRILEVNERGKLKGQGSITDKEMDMLRESVSAYSKTLNADQKRDELANLKGRILVINEQSVPAIVTTPSGTTYSATINWDDYQKGVLSGYKIKFIDLGLEAKKKLKQQKLLGN